MRNRWGIEVTRGVYARAHHPRGGSVSGIVRKFERISGYGWRAILGESQSVSIDDISEVTRVTLTQTRIEVPCTRHKKPSYRWAVGYHIVSPDGVVQYPPVSRAEAYASAREQWPGCSIEVRQHA